MSDVLFTVPVQEIGTDERFTPKWVFESLGETFDLDPASPIGLDTFVPSTARYTREDDGLTSPWFGFVWLNPPFSNATPWAEKFMEHGNGLWLGPVANSKWFDRMLRSSDLIWMMRDFAFVHPTHSGKRSSMPLAMFAYGTRAERAMRRAASAMPAAGVLVSRTDDQSKRERVSA